MEIAQQEIIVNSLDDKRSKLISEYCSISKQLSLCEFPKNRPKDLLQKYTSLHSQIKELNIQLKNERFKLRQLRGIYLTIHAFIRYLQRVKNILEYQENLSKQQELHLFYHVQITMGITREMVQSEILLEDRKRIINFFGGNIKFHINPNFKAVIQEYHIVSIVPA